LTCCGEAPALQFADAHGARAEGDGFEHVAAARDATVENDFGLWRTASTISGSISMVARLWSSWRLP
jgi:hypothetical protein